MNQTKKILGLPGKIRLISLFIAVSLFFFVSACEEIFEEPSEETTEEISLENTLGESQVGNGSTGDVIDYFYNFFEDLSVEFYRFTRSNNRINLTYNEYISLYGDVPPILTLQTFPEFLVEITSDDADATERQLIDSLTIMGQVLEDSVTIFSESFRNLVRLEWDTEPQPELQRYRPVNSDEVQETQTVLYQDTMDVITYAAIVDTPLISGGIMFVDSAEWTDTTYYYSGEIPLSFPIRLHSMTGRNWLKTPLCFALTRIVTTIMSGILLKEVRTWAMEFGTQLKYSWIWTVMMNMI